MIGPGTQIGFSGVGQSAPPGVLGLVGGAPVPIGGTTQINLTTEGTQDWCQLQTASAGGDPTPVLNWHWKRLGGFLRDTFKWSFRAGSNTAPNQTDSLFQFSATDPDDARTTGTAGAPGNLVSSPNYPEILANSVTNFINWGWIIRAKAAKVTRQLNVYVEFQSGGAATNGAFQLVAHLSDNSAPDVTINVAPGDATKHFYKISFTYNAHTDGAELVLSCMVSVYGDSGQSIGFMGATLQ